MKYCSKCAILSEEEICPVCGRSIADVQANDYVFLVEKELMWAEMLMDALEDNGIRAVSSNVMGAGLTVRTGVMTERLRIFVPYGSLELANEITDLMFGETEE